MRSFQAQNHPFHLISSSALTVIDAIDGMN